LFEAEGEKMSEQDKLDFDYIKGKFLRIPLSLRGWPKWLVWLLSLLGLVYILNPGAGIIELVPDFVPGIGNLDEGLAFLMVYYGIMEFFAPQIRRQYNSENDEDVVDAEWSDEE
jgi:uncharacterized membrane protein YkvA (DUF1232 family)